MQVLWKALCSFGIIFWCTMCIFDYFFGSIIQKGEFTNLRDVEFDTVSESLIQLSWTQIIIWCLFSFTISFGLCYLSKIIKLRVQERREEVKETANNTSEIVKDLEVVTLCETKPSFDHTKEDINSASSCALLDIDKNESATEIKSETPTTSFEKRCSKLKNEMTELQMSSWKEYSIINKKLETITKEKRALSKQLMQSQKENNNYKKQLGDILNDRTSLLKRLESATKEIRHNTCNKKTTLNKLEEAINCSTQMRERVLKLTQENGKLEEKIDKLQRENQRLKDEMGLSINESRNSKTITSEDSEIDLKQSERDIEKVQTKLLDLEKSLEKMRYLNAKSNQELELIVEHVEVVENQVLEIQHTRSEDGSVEDLQAEIQDSENVLTTVADSKFEISDRVNTCYVEKECNIEGDEIEESKKDTNPSKKGAIVYNYESSTTSTSVSSSETSRCEDTENTEDLDSISCNAGIISQSPVFQKFLLKTLNSTTQSQPLATN